MDEVVLGKDMTLRDWFAGQALMGLAANPYWRSDSLTETSGPRSIVDMAYRTADAMLEARKAQEEVR